MEIARTQEEIDAVIGDAEKKIDCQHLAGEFYNCQHIADTFYARGVKTALLWVTGQTDDNPMED